MGDQEDAQTVHELVQKINEQQRESSADTTIVNPQPTDS